MAQILLDLVYFRDSGGMEGSFLIIKAVQQSVLFCQCSSTGLFTHPRPPKALILLRLPAGCCRV